MSAGDEVRIRVLHVDDDEQYLDLTQAQLERADTQFSIDTETDATVALERIQEEAIDCVVSDYNMPEMNGIEFLKEVRSFDQEFPFILFTGRGSEEIASDAITAGVTDYLQKKPGSERYTMLANRITNAVDRYRAMQAVEETREYYHRILEHSSDYVIIVDGNGVIDYVSPSVERVMGYAPAELIGTNAFEFPHPDDREHAVQALSKVIEQPNEEVTVEYRAKDADGNWRWIEVRGGNLLQDPHIEGILVNVRDVTERKRQQKIVDRQAERFEELTAYMSHDVNNQLMLIEGYLELAEMEQSSENIAVARRAVERVETALSSIRQLAKSGPDQLTKSNVEFDTVAKTAWNQLASGETTFSCETAFTLEADPERLEVLISQLLRNAIECDAETVRIEPVTTNGTNGFAIQDDGPGLPVSEPETVFETGFSTDDEGAGLGLAIVKQIVESHGWEIRVDSGNGTRFEVTGIQPIS